MTTKIGLAFSALLVSTFLLPPAQALGGQRVALASKTAASTAKNFSGNVSWYGVPFHGKRTASGKIFDMNKCSSAHLHLPFFTRVLVEEPKSGKSTIVTVLDRGPYVKTRVMDLSREAARQIGTLGKGVAYVDCTILDDSDEGGGAGGDKEK